MLLLAIAVSAAAPTTPVELTGALTQGGVIFGKTEPGATVTLDGRSVRVAKDGQFVFGFGRDAGPMALLEVHHSDGTISRMPLQIAAVNTRCRGSKACRRIWSRPVRRKRSGSRPSRARLRKRGPSISTSRCSRASSSGRRRTHLRRLWQPARLERNAASAALWRGHCFAEGSPVVTPADGVVHLRRTGPVADRRHRHH